MVQTEAAVFICRSNPSGAMGGDCVLHGEYLFIPQIGGGNTGYRVVR